MLHYITPSYYIAVVILLLILLLGSIAVIVLGIELIVNDEPGGGFSVSVFGPFLLLIATGLSLLLIKFMVWLVLLINREVINLVIS